MSFDPAVDCSVGLSNGDNCLYQAAKGHSHASDPVSSNLLKGHKEPAPTGKQEVSPLRPRAWDPASVIRTLEKN